MQKSRLNSTLAIAAIMGAAGHAVVHTGRMTSNRSNLEEMDKPTKRSEDAYIKRMSAARAANETDADRERDAWNRAVDERKRYKRQK